MLELIGLGLYIFAPLMLMQAIAGECDRLDEKLAMYENQESHYLDSFDLAAHIAEVNAKNAGQ